MRKTNKGSLRSQLQAQAEAIARQIDELRLEILVIQEQTVVDSFPLTPDYSSRSDDRSTGPDWFDSLVDEVVTLFTQPATGDPGYLPNQDPGYGSRDVAVWQDGRILALVRRGHDGLPIVTRFDQ